MLSFFKTYCSVYPLRIFLACVLIHIVQRQANKWHKLYPPSLTFLMDFYERGRGAQRKLVAERGFISGSVDLSLEHLFVWLSSFDCVVLILRPCFMYCTGTDVYHWSRSVMEKCRQWGLETIGSVRAMRERLSAYIKLGESTTSCSMDTAKASTLSVRDLASEGPSNMGVEWALLWLCQKLTFWL